VRVGKHDAPPQAKDIFETGLGLGKETNDIKLDSFDNHLVFKARPTLTRVREVWLAAIEA
jgi:hypothetical protein